MAWNFVVKREAYPLQPRETENTWARQAWWHQHAWPTVTNTMETMSFAWNLGCTPGLGSCGSFRCCALELVLRAERGKDESQRGTKGRDRQTDREENVCTGKGWLGRKCRYHPEAISPSCLATDPIFSIVNGSHYQTSPVVGCGPHSGERTKEWKFSMWLSGGSLKGCWLIWGCFVLSGFFLEFGCDSWSSSSPLGWWVDLQDGSPCWGWWSRKIEGNWHPDDNVADPGLLPQYFSA